MKKQHLGKILTLLLFPLLLWSGSVRATLDKPLIYKGDSATLTLTASGDNITFPSIQEIGGFKVLGTSQSKSITTINGRSTRAVAKSYQFAPTKSVNIPSYEVNVDGENLKTKELSLDVTQPTAASKDAPVQLEMHLDKNPVYVGEGVKLSLTFKRLPQTEFDKVELAEPDLKGLWAKKLPPSPQKVENGYITQTYSYLLFPQQEGNFTIPATYAKLGTQRQSGRRGSMFDDPFFNDPFFSSAFGGANISWKKLYSNDVVLTAKPLPEGLEIYGDFTLKASVDKKKIQANKAVNLTITIAGEGNLDDIEKFEPLIDEAVVYADEPTVNASATDEGYKGVFKQKIAIVADQNFTIPALGFSYFDKKTQTKKILQTKKIEIEVTGGGTHSTQKAMIEQQPIMADKTAITENKAGDISTQTPPKAHYLWLLAGIMIGLVLGLLYPLLQKRLKNPKKQKSDTIVHQIEKAKEDKTLFELLLPFANDDVRIKEALNKLEKNLYKNAHEEIDKDAILDYFEDITFEK